MLVFSKWSKFGFLEKLFGHKSLIMLTLFAYYSCKPSRVGPYTVVDSRTWNGHGQKTRVWSSISLVHTLAWGEESSRRVIIIFIDNRFSLSAIRNSPNSRSASNTATRNFLTGARSWILWWRVRLRNYKSNSIQFN